MHCSAPQLPSLPRAGVAMVRPWFVLSLLLGLAVAKHLDLSRITVTETVSGVFEVSNMSPTNKLQYYFNASMAEVLCLSLNVTMATMAQVEEARRHGLETCRFGWIAEKIPVVPRIKPQDGCGKSSVGVVTWRRPLDAKFDVFCFNTTDLEKAATTSSPLTMELSSPPASPAVTPRLQSPSPPHTLYPSPSSSTLLPPSTPPHPLLRHISATVHPTPAVGGLMSSGLNMSMFLTTLVIMAFLLVATGVLYYKKKRHSLPISNAGQQEEDIETKEVKYSGENELLEQAESDVDGNAKNSNDFNMNLEPRTPAESP